MTLFMTMLAAFQCLLHLYSGHEDIGVGTCAANRPLSEVEGLIGRFANDILVRTDLSGNPTLEDVLLRTRDAALEAYTYQHIPFGGILEELVPRPDSSRSPLFQVMFILQNAPADAIPESPLAIERMWLDTQTAKYDLTVWLKMKNAFEIAFEYKRDLFDEHTIKQLYADYTSILSILTSNPKLRLSDLKCRSRAIETGRGSGSAAIFNPCDGHGLPVESIEKELTESWHEILSVNTIGLDDNFFDLGGDSVRATALLLRIERRFTTKLSLETLLQANTVRQQARILAQTSVPQEAHDNSKPLSPCSSSDALRKELPDKRSEAVSAASTSGKSVFRRVFNRILHVLCRVLPGSTTLRPFLHRLRGVHIQGRVWIGDDVYIENEYPEAVEIHDGAMIGVRTTIVAHTRGAGKIIIGKQAFIGASSVVVTSGNRTLTIGEGAVLMASSVVSSDVEPYTLYGVERAKPLARLTKPFTADTGYHEFITSLRPLTRRSNRVAQTTSDGS